MCQSSSLANAEFPLFISEYYFSKYMIFNQFLSWLNKSSLSSNNLIHKNYVSGRWYCHHCIGNHFQSQLPNFGPNHIMSWILFYWSLFFLSFWCILLLTVIPFLCSPEFHKPYFTDFLISGYTYWLLALITIRHSALRHLLVLYFLSWEPYFLIILSCHWSNWHSICSKYSLLSFSVSSPIISAEGLVSSFTWKIQAIC